LSATDDIRTLERVRGILDTLSGCGPQLSYAVQGYAKYAYPWLISQHAFGVRYA